MLKNVPFDRLTGTTLGNYSLERFIGQSKLGPTFLARTSTPTTYLVRFLSAPMYAAPREHEVYLEYFQYRASQIATLQHPYILPLLDFGVYRGFPYLVSPHIPLRSLRTRIEKNGALNTLTVGRYVDQIATALEYAHEHAVLHGGLTIDSVFIRLDGQLVVADLGVRSLLELNTLDIPRYQMFEWSEGYSPEQLLGRPSSPATDVYALGVVTFYLLTGSLVFDGRTLDEIAQQHLYATIPPLTQWRSDLPPGLYGILGRAMAKDPAQRFHQPGSFANAYHATVVPTNNGTRVPFVISESPGVPVNQQLAAGVAVPLADGQFGENAWGRSAAGDFASASGRPLAQPSNGSHSLPGFARDESISSGNGARPTLMRRFERRRTRRGLLIAALLALLVVVGGVLGSVLLIRQSGAVVSDGGQVVFFSNQNDVAGQTNALRINIQHLAAPPAGDVYQGWIINDQSEQVTNLGRLTAHDQSWSLSYSSASSNLLEIGDKLEVTQEQGVVTAPAGPIILTGIFPVRAIQHVQHLLVSYPETPGKVGLLMGLLSQTRLLNLQAAVLQSVPASRNTLALSCVAQSMLDIIGGKHGAHYHPLTAACGGQNVSTIGDGFGLLGTAGYMASAEEHASLALSQKDATSSMHQHAALMDTAITNIDGWVTTIEGDLLQLQTHPGDLAPVQRIALLADDVYHGVDANGDGQIEAVAGEAGALTAYQQGQLMATLALKPGA
jgi:serine/threonine protein kinase